MVWLVFLQESVLMKNCVGGASLHAWSTPSEVSIRPSWLFWGRRKKKKSRKKGEKRETKEEEEREKRRKEEKLGRQKKKNKKIEKIDFLFPFFVLSFLIIIIIFLKILSINVFLGVSMGVCRIDHMASWGRKFKRSCDCSSTTCCSSYAIWANPQMHHIMQGMIKHKELNILTPIM